MLLMLSVIAALVVGWQVAAFASHPEVSLTGSNFEIDTDANLKVNDAAPSIDWANVTEVRKADTASGSQDESFGQGTKEDTAVPSVVDGSIPPNKSDLKFFGVYQEGNSSTGFLNLFWSRVQDPSGTTNMDFELNKRQCTPNQTPADPDCTANGLTPIRSVGDVLVIYDLSNGGTRATLSIRRWTGSAWGPATLLNDAEDASGSINTSAIAAADSDGIGAQSPRTFGEAQVKLSALFGSQDCGAFGSAYLKSRSADSFTAALKDFVPPQAVSISNCAALTTNATTPVAIGSPINDKATLTGATTNAGGSITFKLYSSLADCNDPNVAPLFQDTKPVSGNGDYTSSKYTPANVGTYYWVASYSGDANNDSATGTCGDTGEQSVLAKAPSTIDTAQRFIPQDTATISGNEVTGDGSVDFTLYPTSDCSGTAVYTETVAELNDQNQASTDNDGLPTAVDDDPGYSIDQGNFADGTDQHFSWEVTYKDDTTGKDVTSCVENSIVSITDDGSVTSS
jgi:hypothetical protein